MTVYQELEKLMSHISDIDLKNDTVSKADVAWHIDHCFRVIIGVCGLLLKSDPKEYKSAFNFTKMIVYTTGWMPRGRAKAPKVLLHDDVITVKSIQGLREKANEKLEEIKSLHPKSNFKHHVFGYIDLKESKRFLSLHTKHHLRIIRDIKKASRT